MPQGPHVGRGRRTVVLGVRRFPCQLGGRVPVPSTLWSQAASRPFAGVPSSRRLPGFSNDSRRKPARPNSVSFGLPRLPALLPLPAPPPRAVALLVLASAPSQNHAAPPSERTVPDGTSSSCSGQTCIRNHQSAWENLCALSSCVTDASVVVAVVVVVV